MKCLVCGKDLPENAKFCDSCGARVVQNVGGMGVNNNTGVVNQTNDMLIKHEQNNINQESVSSSISNVQPISQNNDFNTGIQSNINQSSVNTFMNQNNNGSSISTQPNIGTTPINDVNNQNLNSDLNNILTPNENQMWGISKDSSQKKSHKKPLILVIILLVIGVITGIIIWYLTSAKVSPKEVFTNSIKEVTSKLLIDDNIATNYNSITTSFDIKSNIVTGDESLNSIFNITNNIGLSGSMSLDYQNKIISGNVMISYDNQQLTDVVLYGENDTFYVYLTDLYDKYISVPVDSYSDLFTTNEENLQAIKNGIDNAFEIALKDEYLTSKQETINVNGNNKKVNSSILTLDSTNSVAFSNDFKTALAGDDAFIKAIAQIMKIEESELKTTLLEKTASSLEENQKLVITIYTTSNNDFVGVEMKNVEDSEESLIDIFKLDDSNYNIVVKDASDTYSLNLNIKSLNEAKTYTITNYDNSNKIEVTFTNKTTYNDTIKKLDVSNSINFDQLTDSDMEIIENNLMKNNVFMKLCMDFYSFMGADEYNSDSIYEIDDSL